MNLLYCIINIEIIMHDIAVFMLLYTRNSSHEACRSHLSTVQSSAATYEYAVRQWKSDLSMWNGTEKIEK